jgi:hypothetical protein
MKLFIDILTYIVGVALLFFILLRIYNQYFKGTSKNAKIRNKINKLMQVFTSYFPLEFGINLIKSIISSYYYIDDYFLKKGSLQGEFPDNYLKTKIIEGFEKNSLPALTDICKESKSVFINTVLSLDDEFLFSMLELIHENVNILFHIEKVLLTIRKNQLENFKSYVVSPYITADDEEEYFLLKRNLF